MDIFALDEFVHLFGIGIEFEVKGHQCYLHPERAVQGNLFKKRKLFDTRSTPCRPKIDDVYGICLTGEKTLELCCADDARLLGEAKVRKAKQYSYGR